MKTLFQSVLLIKNMFCFNIYAKIFYILTIH